MRAFTVLVLMISAIALGACGKKNLPDQPPDATFPRQYPNR